MLGDSGGMLYTRVLNHVLLSRGTAAVAAAVVLECVLFAGASPNTCVLDGACC